MKRHQYVTRLKAGLLGSALLLTAAPALAEVCGTKGGDLIFGHESKVGTLDQHVNAANATRDVSMNIFETLMTRGEDMAPVLDLADSLDVSEDGLTYTFKLRQGVTFHNGKPLTSEDVAASFDRYNRIGTDRSALASVEKWETPDAETFVITLKAANPIFLESVSASTVPIVIIPSEQKDADATKLEPIGTGPFKLAEFVPDSHIKLVRYDDYKPNTNYEAMTGFAGYREACVDSVTFRMMPEPAAREAALETGEVHIAGEVQTASVPRLEGTAGVEVVELGSAGLMLTYPNLSQAPTDNVKVRQAILAALNPEEILDAANDGAFQLHGAFQFSGTTYYSEAGTELYNQNNIERAKELLKEGGYNGEKIVLLTTRDNQRFYNAALVMQSQLEAAGMTVELLLLDWPTALAKSVNETEGWNFFFTTWLTVTAQGGAQSLRNLADPANVHKPIDNKSDEEFMKHFTLLNTSPDLEVRKQAFADAQARVYDQVMAIPFGVIPKKQAIRDNVKGYAPFFNLRAANVWLAN